MKERCWTLRSYESVTSQLERSLQSVELGVPSVQEEG